jgi:hypothetical protein
MTRIPPLQFKDAFLAAISSVDPQIVALWDARRDYTALILDIIFPKVVIELGISVYNANYYYLDSVFYAERDTDHFGTTATYAKCICIAKEHEHAIVGTAVEMNKLQLFNTPLKVLINMPRLNLYAVSTSNAIQRFFEMQTFSVTLLHYVVNS